MALPETAPPRRNARRLWLRMGVSAVLLAILVVKISSENIVPSHPTTGTLAFLVAGLVLMCGSFVLAAWRWQRVLAVFDAHVPLQTLSKHYLAGQFVGNVLPSTIGGDVLRDQPIQQGRRCPRRGLRGRSCSNASPASSHCRC